LPPAQQAHIVHDIAQEGGRAVTFTGINSLAIVIAAMLGFIASAAWYMSLSRSYAAALGTTVERMAEDRKKPRSFVPYIYALIGNIIIGWVLAGLLAHLGVGQVTLLNGVISAGFV
jgi:hypothetical protein